MFKKLSKRELERITSGEPTLKDAEKAITLKNEKAIDALILNEKTSSEILSLLIDAYEGSANLLNKKDYLPYLKESKQIFKLLNHSNLTLGQMNSLMWAALNINRWHVRALLVNHPQISARFESSLIKKLSIPNSAFAESIEYLRLFEIHEVSEENYYALIKSTDFLSTEVKINSFKKMLSNSTLPTSVLKRIKNETNDLSVLKLIGLHENTSLEIISSLPESLQRICLEDYNLRKEKKIADTSTANNSFKFVVEPETPEELTRSQKRKDDLKIVNKRYLESKNLASILIDDLEETLPFEIKTEFEKAVTKLDKTLTFYKKVSNGPLTLQGEEAYNVSLLRIENSLTNYEIVISNFINLLKISETANETNQQFDDLRIDTKAWSDIKDFEAKL